MLNLKTKLDSKKISKDCFLITYITYDEQNYVLEINYKSGRFVSEKQFPNSYNGIVNMEEEINLYKSEEDVRKYFDII